MFDGVSSTVKHTQAPGPMDKVTTTTGQGHTKQRCTKPFRSCSLASVSSSSSRVKALSAPQSVNSGKKAMLQRLRNGHPQQPGSSRVLHSRPGEPGGAFCSCSGGCSALGLALQGTRAPDKRAQVATAMPVVVAHSVNQRCSSYCLSGCKATVAPAWKHQASQ